MSAGVLGPPVSGHDHRDGLDPAERTATSHGPQEPGATVGGSSAHWWALVGVVLVAQLLVVADLGVPVVRPVLGLLVLLALPTWLLRPSLTWVPARQRTVIALGLVVLAVMVVSLLLNLVLPVVGVAEPLRAPWLAAASTAADLVLLVRQRELASSWVVRARELVASGRDARVHTACALGVTGLALAVVGAVRLNNGAGATVTGLALACLVAAMLSLIVQRGSSVRTDGITIYAVSLALLLATSLRGWYVQGHDVQLEYVSYLLTEQAGRWSMSQFESPYHACLSINIWPLVLSVFSGISGAYVFKLVLQLLYALIPVQCYLWFRQLLPRPMAVLAVTLVVGFPTFTTDLPYLLRQGMAFYFFTLVLLAAHLWRTPDRRGLLRTRALAFVFLLGVMFSHYSTTYTVLMVLVLGATLALAERWWRRRRGLEVSTKPLVLLSWPLIGLLVACTWVWVNPVTNTGGHAGDVLRQTISSLASSRDDTASSSDLSVIPFLGKGPTAQERLDEYSVETQREIERSGASDLVVPLDDPAATEPRIDDPPASPLTGLGRAAEGVGLDVAGANGLLRSLLAIVMQLALLVGAWFLVRGNRLTAAFDRERVGLTVGCIGALGAFVVAPGLSVDYGVLRVFQQGLLIFAPAVVLGLLMMARPLGRFRTPVVAGVVVAVLATLGGLVPVLTGGAPQARPAYSASGPYQSLYSITPQEVAGVAWMNTRGVEDDSLPAVNDGPYARDRLSAGVAVRRNYTFTFPARIPRERYTFLGQSVVDQRRSAVFYSGDLLFYRYPLREVEARTNVVYSNPSSVVLR